MSVLQLLGQRIQSADDSSNDVRTVLQELQTWLRGNEGVTAHEAIASALPASLLTLLAASTTQLHVAVDALQQEGEGLQPLLALLHGVLSIDSALGVWRLPGQLQGAGDGLACLFQPLKISLHAQSSSTAMQRTTYRVVSPAIVLKPTAPLFGTAGAGRDARRGSQRSSLTRDQVNSGGQVLSVGTRIEALETRVHPESGYVSVRCSVGWVAVNDEHGTYLGANVYMGLFWACLSECTICNCHRTAQNLPAIGRR